MGASGLVAWTADGEKEYEFQANGVEPICDCYALNVTSDRDTWLYYYMDFPLVHLLDRRIHGVWEMPVGGSGAFAVGCGYALFRGGYRQRDAYQLFVIEQERPAELVATVEFVDEEGERIVGGRVVGRGDVLTFLSHGNLYQVDVRTVVDQMR